MEEKTRLLRLLESRSLYALFCLAGHEPSKIFLFSPISSSPGERLLFRLLGVLYLHLET